MCRLMGFVATSPQSLRGLLGETYGSFEDFSCGLHGDGWGMAWPEGDSVHCEKEPVPAFTSERYRALVDQPLDALLLHYRWATLSLNVEMGNTHPFSTGTVAFAHNGSISPPDAISDFIAAPFDKDFEGATDSEHYFRAVLSASQGSTLEVGFRSAIRTIAQNLNHSSLNALMLTPDTLYAACFYDPATINADLPSDYYEMNYLVGDAGVLVASSGWEHGEWTPLENGSLLSISLATGEARVTTIASMDRAK